jgi:hypothetical protein
VGGGGAVSGLVEFLTARLGERERLARACINEVDSYPSYPWGSESAELAFVSAHDPAHVLREVEAKRRIVDAYIALDGEINSLLASGKNDMAWSTQCVRSGLHIAVINLALPYADHPDYNEEWKP